MWVWFLSPLPQPGRVSSWPSAGGVVPGVSAAGGAEVVVAVDGAEGAGVVVGAAVVVVVVVVGVVDDVPADGAGAGAGGRLGFGADPRPALAAREFAPADPGIPATGGVEPTAPGRPV